MSAAQHRPTDLVHASHVRLAYRAMLGREASDEEVRVQLAGLRTTGELLHVLSSSAEFTGSARVLLDPKPGPSRVNIWHPELEVWTHQPGTVSADLVAAVGTDGWLFIQGGSNNTLEQHTGALTMADGWADGWQALMEHRRAEAQQRGITPAFVIVPDKLSVQGEFFPAALEIQGPRPVERLLNELSLPLTYPLAELREAAKTEQVYLRTDSHYTLHGNYIVHGAVAAALGIEPLPLQALASSSSYVASGDLGSRFDPPIVEVMRSMLSYGQAHVAEDNRDLVAARGGHIGSRRVFRNETASDPRTVVVFGDSYGFAGEGYEGLSWFMAQLFREVHFVWAPFGWDAGYAQKVGADVVVSQTAERFVARVPAITIDTEQLVAQASGDGQAVSPDAVFSDEA